MNPRTETFHLLATCAAGVESLVGDELEQLGYDVQVEKWTSTF